MVDTKLLTPPRVPRFDDIRAAIPVEAALLMIQEFGGEKCHIPLTPTGTRLEAVIGPEAAAVCCSIAAGLMVKIPAELSDDDRRRDVIELRRHGWTTKQIAVHLTMTERAVWRVLHTDPP